MSSKTLRGWVGLVADQTALETGGQDAARAAASVALSDINAMFSQVTDGEAVLTEVTTGAGFSSQAYLDAGKRLLADLGLSGGAKLAGEVAARRKAEDDLQTTRSDLSTVRSAKQDAEREVARLTAALAAISGKSTDAQIKALQQQLQDAQDDLDDAKTKIVQEKSYSAIQEAEVKRLAKDNTDLRAEIVTLAKTGREKNAALDQSKIDLHMAEQALADARDQLDLAKQYATSDAKFALEKAQKEAQAKADAERAALEAQAKLDKEQAEATAATKAAADAAAESARLHKEAEDARAEALRTQQEAEKQLQEAAEAARKAREAAAASTVSYPTDAEIDTIFWEAASGATPPTGKVIAVEGTNTFNYLDLKVGEDVSHDLATVVKQELASDVDDAYNRVLASVAFYRSASVFNSSARMAGSSLVISDELMVKVLKRFLAPESKVKILLGLSLFDELRTLASGSDDIQAKLAPTKAFPHGFMASLELFPADAYAEASVCYTLGLITQKAIDRQTDPILKAAAQKLQVVSPSTMKRVYEIRDYGKGRRSDNPKIKFVQSSLSPVDSDIELAAAADVSSALSSGTLWDKPATAPVKSTVNGVAAALTSFFST